jgi:hypothetical protein
MRRGLFAAAAGMLVAAGLSLAGASSATAATPLVCTNQGSPTVRVNGGAHSAELFFLYGCNQDPSTVGVSGITETLGLRRLSDGATISDPIDRPVGQQSAATEKLVCASGLCPTDAWIINGQLQPFLTLELTGHFTYGSVPGCGRRNATTVICVWHGPTFTIT